MSANRWPVYPDLEEQTEGVHVRPEVQAQLSRLSHEGLHVLEDLIRRDLLDQPWVGPLLAKFEQADATPSSPAVAGTPAPDRAVDSLEAYAATAWAEAGPELRKALMDLCPSAVPGAVSSKPEPPMRRTKHPERKPALSAPAAHEDQAPATAPYSPPAEDKAQRQAEGADVKDHREQEPDPDYPDGDYDPDYDPNLPDYDPRQWSEPQWS